MPASDNQLLDFNLFEEEVVAGNVSKKSGAPAYPANLDKVLNRTDLETYADLDFTSLDADGFSGTIIPPFAKLKEFNNLTSIDVIFPVQDGIIVEGVNEFAYSYSYSGTSQAAKSDALPTGKKYFEVRITNRSLNSFVGGLSNSTEQDITWNSSNDLLFLHYNGVVYPDNIPSGLGTINNNDILMFAYDTSTMKAWVGKNGTWSTLTGDPESGVGHIITGSAGNTMSYIVGSGTNTNITVNGTMLIDNVSQYYTIPTGFTTYINVDDSFSGVVYVQDAIPTGGNALVAGGDVWNWITENPTPYSGTQAHQSNIITGTGFHYFVDATQTLPVGTGNTLVQYVYIDPANVPREIMLMFRDTSNTWEHRAYWGENLIGYGTDGTDSRRYMGPLPATGQWVKLEIPASDVGLEGVTVEGCAYVLYDGRVTWDITGME